MWWHPPNKKNDFLVEFVNFLKIGNLWQNIPSSENYVYFWWLFATKKTGSKNWMEIKIKTIPWAANGNIHWALQFFF
jgi:hypothetical protein